MSALRRRLVAARASRDEGLTLAEMLVTMFLMGMVGTLMVTFFISFTRTFTEDRAATDSTTQASAAMTQLTRVVRSGTEIRVANAANTPVFTTARTEQMVLHAYIDTSSASPAPTRFEFRIRVQPDGTRELVQTRCPANAASGPYWTFQSGAACTQRLVARHISARAGSEPFLFGYEDSNGAPMTVPTSGAFTTDQLRSISRVNIYLKVQADVTSRAEPVVLVSTVGIPNLGVDRVGAGA